MLGASLYTAVEVVAFSAVTVYVLVAAFFKVAERVEQRKRLRLMAARRRRRELRDLVKPQPWTYR